MVDNSGTIINTDSPAERCELQSHWLVYAADGDADVDVTGVTTTTSTGTARRHGDFSGEGKGRVGEMVDADAVFEHLLGVITVQCSRTAHVVCPHGDWALGSTADHSCTASN